MPNAIDLTGKRFKRLLVISRAENNKYGKAKWNCVCDCGGTKTALGAKLTNGETKSCGCLLFDVMAVLHRKHGDSSTRTYSIWLNMRRRCRDPKNPGFAKYGARGIGMCDEWFDSYPVFLNDMGYCPDGLSIDRIDGSKGYSPSNCRWATPKQQTQNSSKPRLLTFNGETRNVREWAAHLGINQATLSERLDKWSIEDALGTRKTHRFRRKLSQN